MNWASIQNCRLTHAAATMAALGLSAVDGHCWGHFGPIFHVGDVAFVWVGLLIGARHLFLGNQLQLGMTVGAMASEEVTITWRQGPMSRMRGGRWQTGRFMREPKRRLPIRSPGLMNSVAIRWRWNSMPKSGWRPRLLGARVGRDLCIMGSA